MTGKIFRGFVLVCTCVFLVCVGLFMWVLHGSFAGSLNAELAQQTDLVAEGVEYAGVGYLEQVELPNRVTWIAADGTVLFDNQAGAADMENHADREEIREALETGRGESVRRSATLSERTVYAARRLSDGTVIRVAESQRTATAMVLELMPPMFLILCAVLVLALLLSSRLSRRLVTPILNLDLEHPERCHTYDELAPLLTRIRRQNETIRRQMDELRRQQEEFNDLAEHMSEGLILLDRRGRVLTCNSAALSLLDVPGELVRGGALELYREEAFRSAVEGVLSGRRSMGRILRSGRCIQIMADPVVRGGEHTGAVLVLLDVTERENSEQLRREFTANVSHELKTPLTSISGMAEIMKSGIVRPEDMQEFAGDIHRESRRLIALVEDIIHLSRLDEGGQLPEREDVELLDVAEQVIERLRLPAEQNRVSLHVEGTGFFVRGIPAVLEEMVYNLCDNAVKYNRPGGSVVIRVEEETRTVTVSDTGIGIPKADQERVFERFYRVDKSRSRSIGGTGLGLSIVKHAAAVHDVRIELSSVPEQGTTVKLVFPQI